MPAPRSGSPDDSDFGPLIESTRNMPQAPRGGRRGRPMDDEEADEGGMGGEAGGGGSLGDILNDILTGGRGMPGGGDPRGGPGGGFPRWRHVRVADAAVGWKTFWAIFSAAAAGCRARAFPARRAINRATR